MRTSSIVVWEGGGTQPWRWHLKAANGKVIAQGEGHPTQAKAIRAAEGVIRTIEASIICNPKDEPLKFYRQVMRDATYITWS